MSDDIGSDVSDVDKLAADLGTVPDNAGGFIRSAVQYTATEVKKTAQASVQGGSHAWSALPNSIDYDIKGEASDTSTLTADVGYNKGRGAGKHRQPARVRWPVSRQPPGPPQRPRERARGEPGRLPEGSG